MDASFTDDCPSIQHAQVSDKGLHDLLQTVLAERYRGRPIDTNDRLVALRALAERGAMPSLEQMLPSLLRLDNNPYSLDDHYPFAPMFRAFMPKKLVLKTGRQVSKSTSLAAHGVVLSNAKAGFKTLYVTPLYEQIRRFSNNYVRPFIDQSPIKACWSGTNTENSVLQRSFKNLSLMVFSFALLDADRVRGVSAHKVAIDEVQDMDPDHLPIIAESLSHSKWALQQFTGTPKTLDGTLEGLWKQSSQAEWFVPCLNGGCNVWNIPSREYHLEAMIGEDRDDISERHPATVCYKCRKPINPRFGRWVHKYRELRWAFAGYHVPQIILPLHFSRRDKWAELLYKRRTVAPHVFWNEVLGESIDAGQKLVTETDLKKVSDLPWDNDPEKPDPQIKRQLRQYVTRMLAIDWGGGGEKGLSFTVIAVLGFRANGRIDCLWAKRLLFSADHVQEAVECLKWYRAFNCDFIAHDYTGAGELRETVLLQAGIDPDRVMGFRLQGAAKQDIVRHHPPSQLNKHAFYMLDKARSLLYSSQAIKLGLLHFFRYDWRAQEDPGLIAEWLALMPNKTETRLAGDVFTITRNPLLTDDFAQAVNIGCAALWHMHEAWPDFAVLAGAQRLSQRQLEAAGNADYGWENESDQFFGMP